MNESDVRDALVRMVRQGRVARSDVSRQSISELCVKHNGHTLSASWYPPLLFGRGSFRDMQYDGRDVPLGSWCAREVLRAMWDLADIEFERRAQTILADYPSTIVGSGE